MHLLSALCCVSLLYLVHGRSVGCIMAELLQREPLFKGSDYIDQLRKIIAAVGRPAEKELDFIVSSRARAFVRSLEGRVRPAPAHLQLSSTIMVFPHVAGLPTTDVRPEMSCPCEARRTQLRASLWGCAFACSWQATSLLAMLET